jgi:hypothetical protein
MIAAHWFMAGVCSAMACTHLLNGNIPWVALLLAVTAGNVAFARAGGSVSA